MKVRQYNEISHNANCPNFKGSFYNSKPVLNGLKYASEHAAIVTAGTTFALSSIVRPVVTLLTPNVKKEDKQNAFAKSLAAGTLGLTLTSLVFAPIAKSFDNITKNPSSFLSTKTVKTLKNGSKNLDSSSAYNFIKQLVKLSPQILVVIPKTALTCALIPPLTKLFFKNGNKKTETTEKSNPSFKGATDKLSKKLANIIENKKLQEVALKYNESNFIQHVLSLKDVFAASCFAASTMLNPQIKKTDKKPLIYNVFISTGLTITGSYAVNKAIEKPCQKFVENFKKANKNDKDLYKYLAGLKVIKPILIMGTLYYGVIPMLSTFFAGKLSSQKQDKVS